MKIGLTWFQALVLVFVLMTIQVIPVMKGVWSWEIFTIRSVGIGFLSFLLWLAFNEEEQQ